MNKRQITALTLLVLMVFGIALGGCEQSQLEPKDIGGTWKFDVESYLQLTPELKKNAADPVMRKMVGSMLENVCIKIDAEKKTLAMGTQKDDSSIGNVPFEVTFASADSIKLLVKGERKLAFKKIDADTFIMQTMHDGSEIDMKIVRSKQLKAIQ